MPPLFVADENTTGRLVSACRACNGDLRMCASANLRERLVYAWCYASRRRFWADANGTSTFSLKQRQADRDRIQKLKHRCELLAQLMAREGKDPHEMFERVKETVRQRMFVMATNLCIAEAARMKGARVVKQREPK